MARLTAWLAVSDAACAEACARLMGSREACALIRIAVADPAERGACAGDDSRDAPCGLPTMSAADSTTISATAAGRMPATWATAIGFGCPPLRGLNLVQDKRLSRVMAGVGKKI